MVTMSTSRWLYVWSPFPNLCLGFLWNWGLLLNLPSPLLLPSSPRRLAHVIFKGFWIPSVSVDRSSMLPSLCTSRRVPYCLKLLCRPGFLLGTLPSCKPEPCPVNTTLAVSSLTDTCEGGEMKGIVYSNIVYNKIQYVVYSRQQIGNSMQYY